MKGVRCESREIVEVGQHVVDKFLMKEKGRVHRQASIGRMAVVGGGGTGRGARSKAVREGEEPCV